MFIPTVKSKIKIGDDVILKHDVGVTGGFFTTGHKFKVINMYDVYGYNDKFFDVVDEDGIIIKKLNSGNFYKNIKYEDAKRIQEKINYKNEVLKCIKNDCKNITDEIDGRDTYDGCVLKKDVYYPICKPSYSCVIYSEKTKEKYPELLRYLKIKKLKK